jgi:hypothetical protein
MGIFFTTEAAAPSLRHALVTALNEQPPANAQAAQARAVELAAAVQARRRALSPWSALIAFAFLVVLFAGCIYTAHDEKMAEVYKVLFNSLQIMLGLVPGAILGEAAATS